MQHKALLVDDEPYITETLKRCLCREPYKLICANSVTQGLDILKGEPMDVVISDENMPDMKGSEFLSIVRQLYPDIICMILTGYITFESAVKATSEDGIYRFFTKPCNEIDLAIAIRQGIQQRKLLMESKRLIKVAQKQRMLLKGVKDKYPDIDFLRINYPCDVNIKDTGNDPESIVNRINVEVGEWEELF